MSNTDSKTGFIKGLIKFAPQPLPNTVEWRELNWRKIQKAIFKLQKRVYRAYVNGDVKKGRRLQKTLIKSYYNRLLSVRKVTQDNSGKKTAGVDKVKSVTPKERFEMAQTLKLGNKSKPIRRGGHGAGGLLQPVSSPFWIPKPGKEEKRFLSPALTCHKYITAYRSRDRR